MQPRSAVTRAALRYFGGKWKLAEWILDYLPPHECYAEPFGGAMSVLLQKPPAKFEVYNDRDGEVCNFFRVLRETPDALIRAVDCTPFSRQEIDLACEPYDAADGSITPLEAARRLYVRAWQSIHGAPAAGRMGWRYEVAAASKRRNVDAWRTAPAHLWSVVDRLKEVQLECDDALKLFARFDRPTTLWYVDPPYVASTRGARWATAAYKHELNDWQHEFLATTLKGLKGMVVLSGYACPLYDRLYGGWRTVTRQTTTQASKAATETLWLNPACSAALALENGKRLAAAHAAA